MNYINTIMPNTYLHENLMAKIFEDEEDQSTQAQTLIREDNKALTLKIKEKIDFFNMKIVQQQGIFVKVTKNTYSADKILKFISGIIKFLKANNLLHKLKNIQNLSAEIGQLRRLLRVDRVILLAKQIIGYFQRQNLSNHDKMMMIFKSLLIVEDFHDIIAYLIHLKVFQNSQLLVSLRRRIANIYFMECLGWLIFYIYEYSKSSNEEMKSKCKVNMIRYCLDMLISHNETSIKLFSLNPKVLTILGLSSCCLNLSLVWK